MTFVAPARQLLRAKDLADSRYAEPLDVAALLRTTDRSVADICITVGLRSIGSFTTSFRRAYGQSPTQYRAAYPPAASRARIPTCMQRVWARPLSATLTQKEKRT